MNALVYIGIFIFAVGLFLWLFAGSKLRGLQNSFVPVSPGKIRCYQVFNWLGILMFVGGLLLSIFSIGRC